MHIPAFKIKVTVPAPIRSHIPSTGQNNGASPSFVFQPNRHYGNSRMLTHYWSIKVGPFVQIMDTLNRSLVGAFVSIDEEIVSTAFIITTRVVVSPVASAIGAHGETNPTLRVQLVVVGYRL